MKMMVTLLATSSLLVLGACETVQGYLDGGDEDVAISAEDETVSQPDIEAVETVETVAPAIEKAAEPVAEKAAEPQTAAEALQAVLDAQPEDVQARYDARHPADTLALFEIEPGMIVVEALPGGGWYSKILMPYLGADGTIVGAQYPDDMWAKLFRDADPERIAARVEATAGWVDTATEWGIEDGPAIKSFQMTTAPDEKVDLVDAVLYIRALHNMNRADEDHSTFNTAIAESYRILKPGGIAGVVQHRAPEANSDEWAVGNAGYMKQSYVISSFEAAGFVLEEASEINANAADVPTEDDIVWRLPPVLGRYEEGTPEHDAVVAIGESDRMTLKFRKPEMAAVEDVVEDAVEAVTEAVEDAVEVVTGDES